MLVSLFDVLNWTGQTCVCVEGRSGGFLHEEMKEPHYGTFEDSIVSHEIFGRLVAS